MSAIFFFPDFHSKESCKNFHLLKAEKIFRQIFYFALSRTLKWSRRHFGLAFGQFKHRNTKTEKLFLSKKEKSRVIFRQPRDFH